MNLRFPDRVFYFILAIDREEYPELELLPTEDERQEIIHAFHVAEKQTGWWLLFGALYFILVLFYISVLSRIWPFSLLPEYAGLLPIAFGLALSTGCYYRILGRRQFPVFLRAELRRRGVLVCMGCGYDLCAHASDRCPECALPASEGPECGTPEPKGESAARNAPGDTPILTRKPFRASWRWIIVAILGPVLYFAFQLAPNLLFYFAPGVANAIGVFVVVAIVLGVMGMVVWAIWGNRKHLPGRCRSCGRRLADPKTAVCPKCHGRTGCCPACGFKSMREDDECCHKCGAPLSSSNTSAKQPAGDTT